MLNIAKINPCIRKVYNSIDAKIFRSNYLRELGMKLVKDRLECKKNNLQGRRKIIFSEMDRNSSKKRKLFLKVRFNLVWWFDCLRCKDRKTRPCYMLMCVLMQFAWIHTSFICNECKNDESLNDFD